MKPAVRHAPHCDPDALLATGGLRKTVPRRAVLRRLIEDRTLWSAARLLDAVKDEAMDRATVYRVLQDLEDARLVRRMSDESGAWYEIDCGHNPVHPHFKCDVCGKLECLAPLAAADARRLGRLAGRRSLAHLAVRMNGRCADCVTRPAGR